MSGTTSAPYEEHRQRIEYCIRTLTNKDCIEFDDVIRSAEWDPKKVGDSLIKVFSKLDPDDIIGDLKCQDGLHPMLKCIIYSAETPAFLGHVIEAYGVNDFHIRCSAMLKEQLERVHGNALQSVTALLAKSAMTLGKHWDVHIDLVCRRSFQLILNRGGTYIDLEQWAVSVRYNFWNTLFRSMRSIDFDPENAQYAQFLAKPKELYPTSTAVAEVFFENARGNLEKSKLEELISLAQDWTQIFSSHFLDNELFMKAIKKLCGTSTPNITQLETCVLPHLPANKFLSLEALYLKTFIVQLGNEHWTLLNTQKANNLARNSFLKTVKSNTIREAEDLEIQTIATGDASEISDLLKKYTCESNKQAQLLEQDLGVVLLAIKCSTASKLKRKIKNRYPSYKINTSCRVSKACEERIIQRIVGFDSKKITEVLEANNQEERDKLVNECVNMHTIKDLFGQSIKKQLERLKRGEDIQDGEESEDESEEGEEEKEDVDSNLNTNTLASSSSTTGSKKRRSKKGMDGSKGSKRSSVTSVSSLGGLLNMDSQQMEEFKQDTQMGFASQGDDDDLP